VTSSASKSISVLYASLRVAAVRAREAGDDVEAMALDGEAQAIQDALLSTIREGLSYSGRWPATSVPATTRRTPGMAGR
jgi:hypothetical protein